MIGNVQITHGASAARVRVNGQTFRYFGGCDYLGLARDPVQIRTAVDCLRRGGLGVSASRITSGERQLYCTLEEALAGFIGTEDAVIFPSGSLSNIAVVQSLQNEVHAWLADANSHPSFIEVFGHHSSKLGLYDHIDAEDLYEKLLRKGPKGFIGVFTDGLFSLSGDIAPLHDIFNAVHRSKSKAIVVIDDAHGIGVLGRSGRGIVEYLSLNSRTSTTEFLITGTLSKALGSFGGFAAGSKARIQSIRATSAAYRASSPLPPFLAATALASLNRLKNDPSIIAGLRQNIQAMGEVLTSQGLKLSNPVAPIFFLEDDSNERLRGLCSAFHARKIIVPLLANYSRSQSQPMLRWIVNRAHSLRDIAYFGRSLSIGLNAQRQ